MTETEENNSQNIIMGERQLLIVTQAIQITRNSPLMLKAKNKKRKNGGCTTSYFNTSKDFAVSI